METTKISRAGKKRKKTILKDDWSNPTVPNIEVDQSGLYIALKHMGWDEISAMEELIDNSLDAGATKIDISYKKTKFGRLYTFEDNGCGMDRPTTMDAWSHYYNQNRVRSSQSIGKFGIGLRGGLVTLVRTLGTVTIESHKDSVTTKGVIKPEVDMRGEFTSKYEFGRKNGTKFTWESESTSQISHLKKKFGVTYFPAKVMRPELEITINGEPVLFMDPFYREEHLDIWKDSIINSDMDYDSIIEEISDNKKIDYTKDTFLVNKDEFQINALHIYPDFEAHSYYDKQQSKNKSKTREKVSIIDNRSGIYIRLPYRYITEGDAWFGGFIQFNSQANNLRLEIANIDKDFLSGPGGTPNKSEINKDIFKRYEPFNVSTDDGNSLREKVSYYVQRTRKIRQQKSKLTSTQKDLLTEGTNKILSEINRLARNNGNVKNNIPLTVPNNLPSYKGLWVTPSKNTDGSYTINFELRATAIAIGTTVGYTFEGLNKDDLNIPLNGKIQINKEKETYVSGDISISLSDEIIKDNSKKELKIILDKSDSESMTVGLKEKTILLNEKNLTQKTKRKRGSSKTNKKNREKFSIDYFDDSHGDMFYYEENEPGIYEIYINSSHAYIQPHTNHFVQNINGAVNKIQMRWVLNWIISLVEDYEDRNLSEIEKADSIKNISKSLSIYN